MKDQFIPYEQAVELKELGFDDEVLKVYDINSSKSELYNYGEVLTGDDELYAPLYQQAFRWFREKYGLYSVIDGLENRQYYKITQLNTYSKEYNTYEEAELECLKKLIEIVKQK